MKDEEILVLSLEKPSFFEVLVDRYQDSFLRTAFKIVNHREEAEDVVQDAFTKIYLHAKSFRKMEEAGFKSWAYKIVINTALTHYKKLKKTQGFIEYNDTLLYEHLPDSNNLELEIDAKILIAKVISRMPKHLGDALRKYYLEDKSQKEIAGEEKVSLPTIKMRLFRARKLFKKFGSNLSCTI